ncbi:MULTISPECIES: response regulator [unclassified Paenibacillus]|uniref:response regulator transcription factor n=1 Tax=unclassified Paenibacillus TaxID=185978 RepID=UPI00278449A6|nr:MULTISPECIES: response regulator [unclassified Paenibacillus]MDQ0897558.1 two-component system response regulator YesN [Paenibacillus sp. V4I7]MDQ0916435.1 two-component system response regulator YesN [Paenibacillus sp. V4I5]
MLQALIVDDEPSHVQGLIRHIPWTSLGYTIPLAAETGESAISLLQDNKIDVLITDVSMPGMNGIELAAAAKSIHPEIQILIISGYNEFEFAQEAIEVGAQGYVLKPLKLGEIERKLTVFRQTLEQIKQINEQTLRLKAMVSGSQELLKESFIIELLEDETMEGDMLASWCHLLNLPSLTEGIQLIVVAIDDYILSGNDAKSRLMLNSALLQSVSVALQDMGFVLVSKLRPDGVAAILVNPTAEMRSWIDKQMSFIQDYMRNTYQVPVTIGISRGGCVWTEIGQLLREVKYTIADALQSGSGQLVHVGRTERKAYEDFRLREIMLPGLLTLAESDEPDRLVDEVGRAFEELEANAHSFAYIRSFSISLMGELSRKLWHDMEALTNLSNRAWHRLLECKTVGSLKNIVLEYIDSALALAGKERTIQQHHLIHRIASYIEDQLPISVTVKQLADMFHLSAGHLSVLFKKETGQTISDYVKGLRMKKAKELLQDPTIKIYEAAERVGFQTPAYFTYQFKKNEGCTPQEYRDRYYR